MRRLAVVAVALFLVAGCSSSNKGKIEGTKWSSMAAKVKGQDIPAGILTLEFTSDGKLLYGAGPKTFTGKYSLGMGDNITFDLDEPLQGQKKHVEKISVEGDTLTMKDSDGTTLQFKKVGGGSAPAPEKK